MKPVYGEHQYTNEGRVQLHHQNGEDKGIMLP